MCRRLPLASSMLCLLLGCGNSTTPLSERSPSGGHTQLRQAADADAPVASATTVPATTSKKHTSITGWGGLAWGDSAATASKRFAGSQGPTAPGEIGMTVKGPWPQDLPGLVIKRVTLSFDATGFASAQVQGKALGDVVTRLSALRERYGSGDEITQTNPVISWTDEAGNRVEYWDTRREAWLDYLSAHAVRERQRLRDECRKSCKGSCNPDRACP